MGETQGKRFQFSIQELLLAVVLACVGLWLLMPLSRQAFFEHGVRRTVGERLPPAIVIVVSTMCGALASLWLAGRERLGRLGRIVYLLLAASAAWLVVAVVFEAGTTRGLQHATVGAASSLAYAEAQEIYHRTDWDSDGILEYAQSLQELAQRGGLVDPSFAAAEGLPGKAKLKAGYVCKVLKAQGQHAPGGRKSYLDDKGRMTQGYALVMAPGAYDVTGRDMFMISHDGVIYVGDFGPETPKVYEEMQEFDPDPDKGWWRGN